MAYTKEYCEVIVPKRLMRFEVYRLSGNLSMEDRQTIVNNLQSVLEIIPEERKNKVIVAHNFPEGIGLGQLYDMETVIIKPNGKDQWL